jgi:hypothetical protein
MRCGRDAGILSPFVPHIEDDPEGPILLFWTPYVPMATALAYFFADDGFVIAADGLSTLKSEQGREIICRKAQKIFPIPGVDRKLACSFMGRITLYDDAGRRPVFDFTKAFVKVANEIRSKPVTDVNALLSQICPVVQKRLESVRENGGFSRYPSLYPSAREQNIVSIYLDGYVSGYPVRAGAIFYHINQELLWSMNSPHTLNCPRKQWSVLHGSGKIGILLFETDNPLLAAYRTEACKRVAASYGDSTMGIALKDAIEAARNYIRACSDSVIRKLDIEHCRGIGGRIHVATVTPEEGFRWVRKPITVRLSKRDKQAVPKGGRPRPRRKEEKL